MQTQWATVLITDRTAGENVSLHTFKKWPLSALCVVDPNNAFFISRCKDVPRLPSWREERQQQLDT